LTIKREEKKMKKLNSAELVELVGETAVEELDALDCEPTKESKSDNKILEEAVRMKALTIKATEATADQVEAVLKESFPKKSFERNYQNFFFWYTMEVTEEEERDFRQGVELGAVNIGDAEIV